MKNITRVALLCFSVALAGCISSVSDDNETSYGTVAYSYEKEKSDKFIRSIINFEQGADTSGTAESVATFKSGYTVQGGESSAGGRGTLYAAEYKLNYRPGLTPTKWATSLQLNLKNTWYKEDDKSDEDGETIYKADDLEFTDQPTTYVAVKVEYDKRQQTYWVYIAVPASKIGAADDPKVISRFNELRDARR